MKLSLSQLHAFVTLAECLSFTAAAERLRVTQPTLSSTIRNLEELLGARLFDRDTRKVRLTAFGTSVLALAEGVISEAERAEVEIRELAAGRRGVVRLAAEPQYFPSLLGPPSSELLRTQPGLRLVMRDVEAEEAVRLVRRGTVDMALAAQVGDGSDLQQQVVGEQVAVIVMPADHPLARERVVRWSQLEQLQLLVAEHSGHLRDAFNRALVDAGVHVSWDHRVRHVMTAASMVEAGFGLAVMSNHSAASLANARLVARTLTHPRMARPLCLTTRLGHETSQAARDLAALISRHAAQWQWPHD